MRALSAPPEEPTPLPRANIALLLGGISVYALVFLLALPTYVSFSLGGGVGWVLDVGAEIERSLSWSIPSALSVLVAFYAVVIGGQLLNVENVREIRNLLGLVSAFIGAACVLALAYVAAHAVAHPKSWGTAAVLTTFVALICFLAMNIGFLMTSRGGRADAIREELSKANGALDLISQAHGKPETGQPRRFWSLPVSVGVVSVPVGTGLAAVLAGSFGSWGSAVLSVAFGAVTTTACVWASTLIFAQGYKHPEDALLRRVLPIGFGAMAPTGGLAIIVLFADAANEFQVAALAGYVSAVVATVCGSWPLRWTPRRLRSGSVRGFAMWQAARTLTVRRDVLASELAALVPPPVEKPPRLARLRSLLGRPAG